MSDFWRLSAVELADLVRNKQASATEIARDALDRLAAVNPAINAVIDEMPDEALSAAAEVDAAIAAGRDPGPLGGVPITIKVNIDQKGHATTNGLRIQKDLVAEVDSPVVENFRKAGAVIVGRTNTPAFSLRWFTRNGVHGHTKNPRTAAITPGGSSGGAAAALTAGIGAIGHGSDIGGSIRYPAYACGIHGIRPTLGRVAAHNFTGADRHVGGQIMAVSGPLARTVADLELSLKVMMGGSTADPWWVPVPFELPDMPKRAALAVAPEGLVVVPEVEAALREAAKRLEAAGWQVEEVDCPPFREPAALQARLWLAEFRRSAAKAIAEEGDPDATFIYGEMAKMCEEPDMHGLLDTLQRRATLLREWQTFLSDYAVLLCPVSSRLPFRDMEDVESAESFAAIMEAQLTQVGLPLMGLPGLTVSTGMVGDVPVGVQIVGGRYREDMMLKAGADIEAGGVPQSPIDPRP